MGEVWYKDVEPKTPITQGDLIEDCPVFGWSPDELTVTGNKAKNEKEILEGAQLITCANVVVMTQACDLENKKVRNVVLCPFTYLTEFKEIWAGEMNVKLQTASDKAWKRQCHDIRDGFVWNLAMLNKYPDDQRNVEASIVDFQEIFTLPISFLHSLLVQRDKQRIRLLPPYREHLSQSFARYFMRIGLPMPIEETWQ